MQNCTFDTRAKITKEIRTVLAMPLDPRRENQQKLALAKLSHTLRQRVHSKTTLKIFCCFYHSQSQSQFWVIWAVRENQHKLALAKLCHTLRHRRAIQKLFQKYSVVFYHRVQDRGILSQISNMDLQFQVIWAVKTIRENQQKSTLAKFSHTLQQGPFKTYVENFLLFFTTE